MASMVRVKPFPPHVEVHVARGGELYYYDTRIRQSFREAPLCSAVQQSDQSTPVPAGWTMYELMDGSGDRFAFHAATCRSVATVDAYLDAAPRPPMTQAAPPPPPPAVAEALDYSSDRRDSAAKTPASRPPPPPPPADLQRAPPPFPSGEHPPPAPREAKTSGLPLPPAGSRRDSSVMTPSSRPPPPLPKEDGPQRPPPPSEASRGPPPPPPAPADVASDTSDARGEQGGAAGGSGEAAPPAPPPELGAPARPAPSSAPPPPPVTGGSSEASTERKSGSVFSNMSVLDATLDDPSEMTRRATTVQEVSMQGKPSGNDGEKSATADVSSLFGSKPTAQVEKEEPPAAVLPPVKASPASAIREEEESRREIHEGWLQKQTKDSKKWTKRLFVLTGDGRLSFYKNSKDHLKDSMDLAEYYIKALEVKGRDHVFALYPLSPAPDRRNLVLQAPADEEMMTWMGNLRRYTSAAPEAAGGDRKSVGVALNPLGLGGVKLGGVSSEEMMREFGKRKLKQKLQTRAAATSGQTIPFSPMAWADLKSQWDHALSTSSAQSLLHTMEDTLKTVDLDAKPEGVDFRSLHKEFLESARYFVHDRAEIWSDKDVKAHFKMVSSLLFNIAQS